jgi:hypothetical protein
MYAQVVQGGTTLEHRAEMDRIVVEEMIPALQSEPGFRGATLYNRLGRGRKPDTVSVVIELDGR